MLSLLLAFLLFQSSPAVASNYQCAGTSNDGDYQIAMSIEQKGENYYFKWNGGQMIGLGFRVGDQLIVAFINLNNGGVGVAFYEVKPGQLLGKWSSGGGMVYTEDCLAGWPA